jgi:hypothetical protein
VGTVEEKGIERDKSFHSINVPSEWEQDSLGLDLEANISFPFN